MTKMINVFSLRGFDEFVLTEVMNQKEWSIQGFYTRDDRQNLPLYTNFKSEEFCKLNDIPLYFVPNTGAWEVESADLNLVFGFHRIFKEDQLKSAKKTYNLHPSPLPAYKGATPITWMILAEEPLLSITAHEMILKIDAGPPIKTISVINPGWSEGLCRQIIGNLSRKLINEILSESFRINAEHKQSSNFESLQPKRTEESATFSVDEIKTLSELKKMINAFEPWPRLRLVTSNGTFKVDLITGNELYVANVSGFEIPLLGSWIRN